MSTGLHANYGGASVELGLTQEFAAVCCQECLDQAKNVKQVNKVRYIRIIVHQSSIVIHQINIILNIRTIA